jgi:hypothetical protein
LITIVENSANKKLNYDKDLKSHLKRNSVLLGTRDEILHEGISNFSWRTIGDFLKNEMQTNSRKPYLRQEDYH